MGRFAKYYDSPQPHPSVFYDTAVLVQAWKKSHDYLRYHCWFADSLELDISALRLHELVDEWARLLTPANRTSFAPDAIRLVPAPKSHPWSVDSGWVPVAEVTSEAGSPIAGAERQAPLRPLAHLSIRDQTLSMAALIGVANGVETEQGDPSTPLRPEMRKSVSSYGHRLVCRWVDGRAKFRWGSAKLYRQYFDDYQTFIRRPNEMRRFLGLDDRWAIVAVDLTKFYDTIQRVELIRKLDERSTLSAKSARSEFRRQLKALFSWDCHPDDEPLVELFRSLSPADGLPQGLAASGFFSNAYMLDFDAAMQRKLDRRIPERQWKIVDYCRYVDDMRFLVEFDERIPEVGSYRDEFKAQFLRQIRPSLNKYAPGTRFHEDEANKAKIDFVFGGETAAYVPLANAVERISRKASGPIDFESAIEILADLDGLLAESGRDRPATKVQGTQVDDEIKNLISKEPDVRPETVVRFTANKWRRFFREARVMATDESGTFQQPDRKLLDQKAKAFAVDLVERWIFDPSNVRLLRISFDLFPSAEHLKIVLGLLDELVVERGESEPYDSVVLTAKYVASELLRAGATETAFVRDDDELPVRASVVTFREHLANFAVRILSSTTTWYLRDQAILYLAVIGSSIPNETASELPERLRFLVDCLSGDIQESREGLTHAESIAIAMIASRITSDHERAISVLQELVNSALDEADESGRLLSILWNDHELASEVLGSVAQGKTELDGIPVSPEETSLSALVAEHGSVFPDEVLALRFLSSLLDAWPEYILKRRRAVCPNQILLPDLNLKALQRAPHGADLNVVVDADRNARDRRYAVPGWMNQNDRWRQQIGLILRCAILGHPDATSSSRRSPLIEGVSRYRGVRSGVFRRQHGLYSGRSGLGDDFVALSPWFSELLSRLTAWPGTSSRNDHVNIGDSLTLNGLKSIVRARLETLRPLYAANSRVQIYPFPIRLRRKPPEGLNEALDLTSAQSFRVALVQTTLPTREQLKATPRMDGTDDRRNHRRHLASVLRMVEELHRVQEHSRSATSTGDDEDERRIDLVLLPELSVHPSDIHVVDRFVDRLRCLCFCGIVFEPRTPGSTDLVNSGLWFVPEVTAEGRQIHHIRQGKWNLAPSEKALPGLIPYRPAQWLIELRDYPHWDMLNHVTLTGSICYDATDIALATDLRDLSDLFVISALNQDTATFDNMAAALHYHMFQHVAVVNTGEFGGSTIQAPYKDHFKKIVVHHHGGQQVTVAVVDLDLTVARLHRATKIPGMKHPPAPFTVATPTN